MSTSTTTELYEFWLVYHSKYLSFRSAVYVVETLDGSCFAIRNFDPSTHRISTTPDSAVHNFALFFFFFVSLMDSVQLCKVSSTRPTFIIHTCSVFLWIVVSASLSLLLLLLSRLRSANYSKMTKWSTAMELGSIEICRLENTVENRQFVWYAEFEEFPRMQCEEFTVWAIFQGPAHCKQSIAAQISIYTIRLFPKCWKATLAHSSDGHGKRQYVITISLMLLFSVNKIPNQHRTINQQFPILSLFSGARVSVSPLSVLWLDSPLVFVWTVERVNTEHPLLLDASCRWWCWSQSTDLQSPYW